MKLPKFDIRFLYVFYTYSEFFRFKIGITNNVSRRRTEVEQALSSAKNQQVKIRVALYIPSLFSETQEAKIHKWLSFCRDRRIVWHSGYSEWFIWPNIISSVCIYLILKHYGANVTPCHIALFTILPVFPADAFLLVFSVFMVEIIVFLLAVGGIGATLFYLITNFLWASAGHHKTRKGKAHTIPKR